MRVKRKILKKKNLFQLNMTKDEISDMIFFDQKRTHIFGENCWRRMTTVEIELKY